MRLISPCTWYDNNALEAVELYVGLFDNSKIDHISHYIEGGSWPSDLPVGTPLDIEFTLCGQAFSALNGGSYFKPNPSISFFVDCESKQQLESLWAVLSREGEILMELISYPFSTYYGWLNDRYGVSWQLNFSGNKQQITPFLLFTGAVHGKAKAAINYYCQIFDDSKSLDINYYGSDIPGETEGTIQHASFQLEGQPFMAMDSGLPHKFAFTEGTSFTVYCKGQQEIDYFWEELVNEGEAQPCGWVKDKFGLSWQIVPEDIRELSDASNSDRANAVNKALLEMTKIEVQTLWDVYNKY